MKHSLVLPTYLPNVLNMAVMAQSESLIFEVHDNYQKQSLRNRTYINTANGALTLTIPIRHNTDKGRKKTEAAQIENNFLWQRQHWRSIQIAYRSSPFFEFYEHLFEKLFTQEYNTLMEFNFEGIRIIAEILKIDTHWKKTDQYDAVPDLFDFRPLANAKRQNFESIIPEYQQVFGDINDFNPHVSVIDLIFNEGPNARDILEKIDLKNISTIYTL